MSNELETRKIIVHKYLENTKISARMIAKSLNVSQLTVHRTIKRFKDSQSIERKQKSGGNRVAPDKKMLTNIKRSFEQNPSLSDRDRAKRYRKLKFFIRNLRQELGYKSYRAIKYPNRSDKQQLVAKKLARLLYDRVLTKFNGCLLMDDETYVKTDFKQIPGPKFYVAKLRGHVSLKYKYVQVEKFAKKVLIWQAICSCGMKSRGFGTKSNMNSEMYMKECLQKRLLPLIKAHSVPVTFRHDLASCHYSRSTMDWYKSNQVAILPKNLNPPNCP
jgi:transposase